MEFFLFMHSRAARVTRSENNAKKTTRTKETTIIPHWAAKKRHSTTGAPFFQRTTHTLSLSLSLFLSLTILAASAELDAGIANSGAAVLQFGAAGLALVGAGAVGGFVEQLAHHIHIHIVLVVFVLVINY